MESRLKVLLKPFQRMLTSISGLFSAFLKDYDIWFPQLINLLKTISDAVTSFISEFLIKTVLLLSVWAISVYIEIHRIEIGVGFITTDATIKTMTAIFLPFALQVVQHMIYDRDLKMGVALNQFISLRHIVKDIKYRLGIPYIKEQHQNPKTGKLETVWVWLPREKSDRSLDGIKTTIIWTIIITSFFGAAHEVILEVSKAGGTDIPWHQSLNLIFNSSLDKVFSWFVIIMTTLCAVYFEIVISQYVAQGSHDTLLKMAKAAEAKMSVRSTTFTKSISYLRRRGDELTGRSNAKFYNDLLNFNEQDIFSINTEVGEYSFFDSIKRKWSDVYDDYKEYREYLESVNNAR